MAGFQYHYDDSQLQQLFEQLELKQQAKVLRGGFRRAAAKFRKAAIGNLRSSIRTDSDLEKGVRAIVFKQQLGFRVTVGTSGKKGYHLNRFGLLKPVLLWAEDGTANRWTKSNGGKHSRMFCKRKRKSHATGKMSAYMFMQKTKEQEAGNITTNLHISIRQSVESAAKRCGCKI